MAYQFPSAPKTIADTGIGFNLLLTLMLKSMYVSGLATPSEISQELRLPRAIIDSLLEEAREMALVEVLGARGDSPLSELRYALTGKGRDWAINGLEQSQYVGPAPVTLTDFRTKVEQQRIANEHVDREALLRSLSELVLPAKLVARLGPAVNSGRSILLYGPPGNGKTCIAEAIGGVFEQTIHVPHCIEIDGQIIKIFDSTVHREVAPPSESQASEGNTQPHQKRENDQRWIRCRRPVVSTGGELTLEMLDLNFNPYSKFYEAPMQLKATGGVFIIDDFGRQLVSPQDVLNRWIIPMERGVDYLTLHTGKKFPVPFDELVLFSTNIPPQELTDTGSLRRIYYKMEVGPPTRDDYKAIFENECESHGIDPPDDILAFLFEEFYVDGKNPLARYHPRFIVEQVVAICEYESRPRRLERALVADVLQHLYAK